MSISWGLISLITRGCGYDEINKKLIIPQNNHFKVLKKISQLQKIDEKYLIKFQKENFKLIEKKFNWNIFKKKIRSIVLKKQVDKKKVIYSKKEINFFISNTKSSPNYYLKPDILFGVIKSNIKSIFSI